jgi:hypothetical protein
MGYRDDADGQRDIGKGKLMITLIYPHIYFTALVFTF